MSGCGKNGQPANSKDAEQVRQMVNEYMTAIKDKNVEKLMDISGIELDKEMRTMAVEGIKEMLQESLLLDIESFDIKEVKMEGSIAFVTIEENRRFAPKDQQAPGLDSDFKTVTDNLVLLKRDGKWKIDGMNTLHLSQMDLNDPQNILKQINDMSIARILSIAVDPEFVNIGLAISAVMLPNLLRGRTQGQYTACQANMKNIGTALEMYFTDHTGHYPNSIGELTPEYLRMIPQCPSAGEDTYSKTYKSTKDPDYFEFHCSGHHHDAVGVGSNYPQYNSRRGLTPR